MSDDLNRQIFKEEAYDLLGELEGALLELEQAPEDTDLVNQIFRALHTIKGSGSMFGFDDIAEFTHEVESVFDKVRNGDLPVTPTLCSLALKSRDYIRKMLDSADEDEVVAPDEMQEILQGLQGFVLNSADPVDIDEKGAEEPESIVEEVNAGSPADFHQYQITLTAKSDGDVHESKLDSLFEELEKLGEFRVVTRPGDVPGDDAGKGVYWELSLLTEVPRDDVGDIFFFADADLDVEIVELGVDAIVGEESPESVEAVAEIVLPVDKELPSLTDDLSEDDYNDEVEAPRLGEMLIKSGEVTEKDIQEALKKQKPIGQILAEEGKIAPENVARAIQKQSEVKEGEANRKRQEAMTSIRVAADKLDYLVDLVGELVIVQAQIEQVVSERADPVLTALAEELGRLSDELRDSTLSIRMLPIGSSFSKFKRLVRDLSGDLNKEIGLTTTGAETELDKTVIERLADPLVHLLRNSIDHGIETPEERIANGKPPQGMIHLSAEHSGGEVLIRITDDGRGMSSDTIREKGIERGLISKDSELSDKDLLKLIFEPGFSTATEVTNVSGRGVGMDVVKRAIDSLRGTIDIDSKFGKGTILTIRLPLTLAIIDGLQVQIEDGFYVIPLSLVEECVELARSEFDDNESGQKILHLRGEIVPYIHLREWFDIEGESPPIEQIVITGVEGSRIGIVVDTVIGEHQTVIKSLSRVYKDVKGISGATIKGDGSIALILDIPSLVRRVISESR
ncbi:MAG: chemotaxis protein CheA [Pseudodesulfovibrio sp.]|nr:chemotaxis protein CheA [Pseudodesulfovibrio sp.]